MPRRNPLFPSWLLSMGEMTFSLSYDNENYIIQYIWTALPTENPIQLEGCEVQILSISPSPKDKDLEEVIKEKAIEEITVYDTFTLPYLRKQGRRVALFKKRYGISS